MNWMPIETAPKDGTRVLIFSPVDGVVSSHFECGVWQGLPWRPVRNPDYEAANPTHWAHLPSGPITGEIPATLHPNNNAPRPDAPEEH